jgi:uncharacterized protein with FMN-binding domain
MKKYLLTIFVFAASAWYALSRANGTSPAGVAMQTTDTAQQSAAAGPVAADPGAAEPAVPSQPAPSPTPAPAPARTSTPPATPTPTPAPTPAPTKPQGQYADGTYTGSLADAYYGYVKVQAVIQGGKLVTVNFLQYPNDRGTSRYINGQAMPLLEREAIQAQSANVSGVSGATDTSIAFRQSLGDALAQAKNG